MGEDHTYRYVNASNVAGKCDILWTNPNVSTGMSAQKIALDFSNYDGALMICCGYDYGSAAPSSSNYSYTRYPIFYLIKNKTGRLTQGYPTAQGYFYYVARDITAFDNTGITISRGLFSYSFQNAVDTTYDNALLPYRIYGLKVSSLPSY